MNKKNKSLLKLIIIYLIYFSYTVVISYCLKVFGISNEIILIFVSDLLFLIGENSKYIKNQVITDGMKIENIFYFNNN